MLELHKFTHPAFDFFPAFQASAPENDSVKIDYIAAVIIINAKTLSSQSAERARSTDIAWSTADAVDNII